MDLPDRTPVVTVELQLRPQPPKGSSPWFWGAGMLDFLLHRGKTVETVWRAELPPAVTMRSARVKWTRNFGWILVVWYGHDEARTLLAGLRLPDYVEGEASVGAPSGGAGLKLPPIGMVLTLPT